MPGQDSEPTSGYESEILLGPGLFEADYGVKIAEYLTEEWDESHTDSREPAIDFAEERKDVKFDEQEDDWITIYEISEIEEPVAIGLNYSNITVTIGLEFLTGVSKAHLRKMIGEARRVIMVHKTDFFGPLVQQKVGGRIWVRWGIRATKITKTFKGAYHATIDIQINWRARPIVTEEVRA